LTMNDSAAPGASMIHALEAASIEFRPIWEGSDRDGIMVAINAERIPYLSGTCSEIYVERAFPEELRPRKRRTVARELGKTSLMFLAHPTLPEKDMLDTYHAVEKIMNAAAECAKNIRSPNARKNALSFPLL
jgi:hypothetical protein